MLLIALALSRARTAPQREGGSHRSMQHQLWSCVDEEVEGWRSWGGPALRRSRSARCGDGGVPGSRSVRSGGRSADTRGRSTAWPPRAAATCRSPAAARRECAPSASMRRSRAGWPTTAPGAGRGAPNRASWPTRRGCANSSPPSSVRSGRPRRSRDGGWLARTYAGEQALQVSTEIIYRSLFVPARGVLAKELSAHLRTRRTMRRSKNASRKGQGRGIRNAVSIRERPAEAEGRAVPGHWEGDLLAGWGEHAHRHPGRASDTLPHPRQGGGQGHRDGGRRAGGAGADALGATAPASPGTAAGNSPRTGSSASPRTSSSPSATRRRPGSGAHARTRTASLRQYFPRKTGLSVSSQDDLDAVAARLNGRPRKTLAYETPPDDVTARVA